MKWFEIKAQQQTTETAQAVYDVFLLDDIGGWGITAQDFVMQFNQIPADATVRLIVYSGGGNLFDALAMYHVIKERGNVTGKVIGVAASAATIVLMGCDSVEMPANTWMMLHDAALSVYGASSNELRKKADFMDGVSASMLSIYAKRSGKDNATVAQWLSEDTWFTASEALEAGLCDVVLDEMQIAASANDKDLRRHSSAPDAVKAMWAVKVEPEKSTETLTNDGSTVLQATRQCLAASEYGLADLVAAGSIAVADVGARIERAQGIRALAQVSDYPTAEADQLVNQNVSVDAARITMQAYQSTRTTVVNNAVAQTNAYRVPGVIEATRKVSAPPATSASAMAKFNPKSTH